MTGSVPMKPSPGRCPACDLPSAGRPFCVGDGSLLDAFSIAGRYVVEELLGVGAFSFVFGARHHLLDKPVAIKVLRPEVAASDEQAQRFLREARTASQLEHENIVRVSDFGRDDELGLLFLVMERLRGRTLASLVCEAAPLPASTALPILAQLAGALGAAHTAGVIHRDLNPRNIMLVETSGRRDVVKLCDFGLSRLADGDDRITAAGVLVGTPAYIAPEQIRGDHDQDARVDLYALAVTGYEMLTGQLPHPGDNSVALISRKLSEPARPMRDVMPTLDLPADVEQLLMSCLAIDPAARPSSTDELANALAAAAAGRPARAQPADLLGVHAGNYRITGLLGTGSSGSVHSAEHAVIGTRVAIKVLRPEIAAAPAMVERFVHEARTSSHVDSAHIARYFDFGHLDDGRPFAVMEHLDGETVAGRLAHAGKFSVAEAARVVAQVASALSAAHAAGIVHRDIKPENLFLVAGDAGWTVKVLDFGIAKLTTAAGTGSQTTVGLLLGTPIYCAPEQALGLPVGPAADVYALGATAFEMLAGRPPFDGDVVQILGAKTSREAPSIRAVAPWLPEMVAAMLADMLARDPAERASVADVVAAMSCWQRDPRPEPLPAARGWRQWAAPAVIAGVVVALALALWPRTDRVGDAPRSLSPAPRTERADAPAPAPVAVPTAPVAVPTAPAAVPTAPADAGAVASADEVDEPPRAPRRRQRRDRAVAPVPPPRQPSGPGDVKHDDVIIADPTKE